MSTHLEAKQGEIADIVLLPGDPLRAKHIAETFLDHPVQYNGVRNALGFTGTYKGTRISVQGTGMGIPSISIYTNELIRFYGAKKLIRVGTCGGLGKDVKLRDVLIAQSASTDSGFLRSIFGDTVNYAPTADFNLLLNAYEAAEKNQVPVKVGNILSEDQFYNDEINLEKLRDYQILGAEMEAAALYTIAAKANVAALAVLTVSDLMLTGESTSAKEREESFNDMITVALEGAIKTN
ncbi:purine-nucleoside phosphorylase [Levilactobacillus bambusae]|uniref:Purine nucleoside phosphorylase DeoD-type n=1 Tax=Levilactobacillus bambusae TaxID=2024736 RepID=A0A2V1N2B2_9LACO|nr:purine-nucleoside phosphorylase [Levilactobacillus bambusae]PWG00788.1 purine-nucleoside phosphorylase [Levilactobacillus bambusae]